MNASSQNQAYSPRPAPTALNNMI